MNVGLVSGPTPTIFELQCLREVKNEFLSLQEKIAIDGA
jgi:hypothetical protein